MLRRPASLFILFLFFFNATPSFLAQTKRVESQLKEIDEYAAKTGIDWKVPGFAIAIVKNDRVVFAKGYGVRELIDILSALKARRFHLTGW